MIQNQLRGMGVALVTPFTHDGDIDFNALKHLIEYQIAADTDYVVLLGTTAETPTLNEEERAEIIHCAVSAAAGRLPLVLGMGNNDTRKLLQQVAHTDFTGISALLSVTPYYNKPSQEGLYQHYAALAQASPLPILLYNVPSRTGVNMTSETTLRLAHTFDNIVGIKEASGNFSQIDDIIKNKPEHFSVISGDDGITYSLITLGAIGVISVIGNAFPREFSRMVHLALNGDYSQALSIHHHFAELIKLLFVEGNPAGVKSMMAAMGLIENELRLPLVPTTIATYEKIRHLLDCKHDK